MSNMGATIPEVAGLKPSYAVLEVGKSYLWCSCGLSKQQPFCDQSHQGTGFKPVRYVAATPKEVLFCNCKKTSDPPFCDGAHNNIEGAYAEDDPNSEANLGISIVEADPDGRARLNGHCFVASPTAVESMQRGNLEVATLIAADQGALYQSQFHLRVHRGESPVVTFGDRQVIVLATHGSGSINISGREFSIEPETGVYVRPGEAFALTNSGDDVIQLVVSVCPLAPKPEYPKSMPNNFDKTQLVRTVGIDVASRQRMADRFFQLLVDKCIGSDAATQFIGEIPQSKAMPHRHLYEETLVILKGRGYMWTEDYKTAVNPGDVIFLPGKQLHSLECTDSDGMMLAGVIYPGDNPAINY